LLWGESVGSERKDAPQKQPILWVRELAAAKGATRTARDPAATAPAPRPQRIAVTTLGHPGDFANPEIRLIAVQMVAWANERTHALDDADRTAIRAAAFEPPPTR
ncbi:MAG: hypothetical protein ACKO0W_09345, partial [Planctomycetota bacterium]